MISAFGVDHGEISKAAVKMPKVPGAGGFRAMVSGIGTHIGQMARGGATTAGRSAGPHLAAKAGTPNAALKNTLGHAQVNTGRGLKKVSSFATARPGLTGGLALGGVGAVGAGGGYAANSMTHRNQRLAQYR